ncbi:TPA: YhcH/YjgK/YiaL family protein, partial [Aeromonas veronii]
MIVADIEHLNCLPHLKNIIERVISSDLANLSPGEHVIQGKSLYINRVSGKSRHITESKSEIHRDYIDIHLILSGHETIGY